MGITGPEPGAVRHLGTAHLEADLTGRSVRGAAVGLSAQAVKSVLVLVATVFLARKLEPGDFGLVAMVAAVTAFLAQFRDLGLAMSTVQKADITSAQLDGLFWINAGFGLLLCAVTVLLAPALAWFYGEPRLTPIAQALALGVLIAGLAVQHQALLRRQMRFTALAVVEVVSMSLAASSALFSAYLGAGYWALVLLELVLASAMLIGVWVACDWRPGPPRRCSNLRGLLAFGGQLTGFNLINYFIRNLDNVLIGWRWGPRALGFYAKAYELLTLPLNLINAPVAAVAIPGLSRLQHDPPRFRAYYLRALALTALLSMPIAAFLIVFTEEIVLVLLGPKWKDAVDVLRLLALSAALQPVANTAGWLYIATGRTARMLRWGLLAGAVTVTAFVVGLPYGPRGVALAYSGAVVVLMWPCLGLAVSGSSVALIDVWNASWRPAAAAAVSAAAAQGVMMFAAPGLPGWARAALGGTVMVVMYVGILLGAASTRNLYRGVWRELIARPPARDLGLGASS